MNYQANKIPTILEAIKIRRHITPNPSYGLGNINLTNRPVRQNNDGSISTVNSISFMDDSGQEILIPTIDRLGRQMTNDEAIDYYYKTGDFLGKFPSVSQANTYADTVHGQQDAFYNTPVETRENQTLILRRLLEILRGGR
jgi:hypothetical protein